MGKLSEADVEEICQRALRGGELTKHEVNVALRACLVAGDGKRLACCDYSQVEARGLAWEAGETETVEAFRVPGCDPYARLACRLFSIAAAAFSKEIHAQPRDTSKKAELGCGYGMGAPKFTVTAEKGGMVWRPASECQAAGRGVCTDPLCGAVEHDFKGQPYTHGADVIVRTWREVHATIVEFWHALNDAAIAAVGGARRSVGPFDFGMVGGDLWVMLPSGRPLVYRDMHVGRDAKGRPRLHFMGAKGHREDTYGGKLAENLTQALCRDLLAHALATAEGMGIPVVIHVHDELVAEVPEAEAEDTLVVLADVMQDLPAWAAGFPGAVEGFTCRRYRKG